MNEWINESIWIGEGFKFNKFKFFSCSVVLRNIYIVEVNKVGEFNVVLVLFGVNFLKKNKYLI